MPAYSYAPPSPTGPVMPHEQRIGGWPDTMERRCRSPLGAGSYLDHSSLSPYVNEAKMRQGPSPSGSLPYPRTSLSSTSPHSVSLYTRGEDMDTSPRPSSNQASPGRSCDVSPRPLYRPFENGRSGRAMSIAAAESTSITQLATSIASSMSVLDRYRPHSDDDLTASSSLLLLSRPPVMPLGSDLHCDFEMEEEDRPSQSDSSRMQYHQLANVASPANSLHGGNCASSTQLLSADHSLAKPSRPIRVAGEVVARSPMSSSGPAQDHTVASTSPTLFPDSYLYSRAPLDLPHRSLSSVIQGQVHGHPGVNSSSGCMHVKTQHNVARRPSLKVVGPSPLSIAREKRAQRQLKQFKENMKSLIASSTGGRLHSQNTEELRNDAAAAHSEGELGGAAAMEGNSFGQASPGASSSSSSPSPSPASNEETASGVHRDFPIPPDPDLKMSALDYLISEVLVKRIDVPFKPYNKEVNDIYTGVKKGRLTLVDLIELRVEASLKAS